MIISFVREVVGLQRRMLARTITGAVRATGVVVGIPAASVPVLSGLLARLDPTARGTHTFLSPEWIDAAQAVREELQGRVTVKPPLIRMNHVVTDVPFGDGTIEAHTDSTSGDLAVDLGHIEGADATVTLPYDIAKALLVDGDAQAAMQAFVSGRIKVEGDITKLMALQTAQVDPIALEAATRIREITA